jgi:hypothetical protein
MEKRQGIENRYGKGDDHLTDRGQEQLSQTAIQVADKDIEIIFHSHNVLVKVQNH